MKRILLLLLMVSTSISLVGAKRPLRFEDLFSLGRLSSPTLSPDGQWIAFCLRTPDIAANKYKNELFLTDIRGTSVKKLPLDERQPSTPSFLSSDSLSFIADDGEASQVFSVNIKNPTSPQKLTQVPGGIDGFFWLPDKKRLLLMKDVSTAAASLEDSAKLDAEKEKSLVKAKILTSIPFRIFNQWRDNRRSHLFLHSPGTPEYIDLTPGNFDTPPVDLGSGRDFDISPDSRWLAFVKNVDPLIAISTNNDIFIRDMATGKEENLTRANPGNDSGPLFSPKGTHLAFLAMKRPQFEADKRDIILYHLNKKVTVNLTESFAHSITEFVFSPDENRIYFIATQGIWHPIFQLEIKSQRIQEVVPRITASSLSITPDGKQLVFLNATVRLPKEIFSYHVRQKKLTQLTHMNDSLLSDIEMNPIETFTFKGAADEPVEAIMVKPPFFDPQRKYPVVFLVHGGPQGNWNDDFSYRWNPEMFASPGYVVVGINFHGSTGYGQNFTDSISRNWGGLPFTDLILGQKYLAENFPFIDKDRFVAAGASYGGYMINWMAGHMDEFKYPFCCLISHAGIFDNRSMYYSTEELWFEEWEYSGVPWKSALYEKWSPANFVHRFSVPMLVIHGERDYRVPVSQGFMLFTALQRIGVKSKMLYYPDEDHFVSKPQNAHLWWKTMYEWMAEHIR